MFEITWQVNKGKYAGNLITEYLSTNKESDLRLRGLAMGWLLISVQ